MSNNSENKQAVKAGIGYTIGNILVNGIAFLTIPIFTRLLSTADFGIYSSFMTYQAILAMVIGLTIHTSLKNAKYDYAEERPVYRSAMLTLMLIPFVLFLIIGGISQSFWGEALSLPHAMIIPLVIYSFASALMMFFNADLVLDYKYKLYLGVSLGFSLSSVLLSVLFILTAFKDNPAYGRILGCVIPIVLVGLFILCYYFRQHKPVIRRDQWRYGLKISLPLIPHGLSQLVLTQFDRIMILRMIGEAQAGIYSLAYTMVLVLQVIYSSLDSIWTTWFFERMAKKEYGEIKAKSRLYAGGVAVLTVMFFLAAPEVLKLFSAKSFWAAQNVVIPLGLALFFSFLYYFPSGVEYYHKKTIFIAIGTVSAAAINILLNLWLIPLYGYEIAAFTTLISYILYFCFHLAIVWHIEHRFVFDIKAILLYILGVSVTAFLCQLCLGLPLLRWTIFTVMLLAFGYILLKNKAAIITFFKER